MRERRLLPFYQALILRGLAIHPGVGLRRTRDYTVFHCCSDFAALWVSDVGTLSLAFAFEDRPWLDDLDLEPVTDFGHFSHSFVLEFFETPDDNGKWTPQRIMAGTDWLSDPLRWAWHCAHEQLKSFH